MAGIRSRATSRVTYELDELTLVVVRPPGTIDPKICANTRCQDWLLRAENIGIVSKTEMAFGQPVGALCAKCTQELILSPPQATEIPRRRTRTRLPRSV